jgi:hypothetical protein
MRKCFLFSPRCFSLLAFFLLASVTVRADGSGVPISLSIDPATITQGDESRTVIKTTVKLAAPSPDYFICEVRSEDRQKVACTSIIFKKGDTEGTGTATIDWTHVAVDSAVKITAFNVATPDTTVTMTVNLVVKTEGKP